MYKTSLNPGLASEQVMVTSTLIRESFDPYRMTDGLKREVRIDCHRTW